MASKLIFNLIIVTFLLASCSQNISMENGSDELRSIVKKQNANLESCFKEGNSEKLASLYTDSAKLSPNGGDFVIGRNSIKEFWADDFKSSKVLEMSTDVMTTNGNREIIYETGKTRSKILYQDSVYRVLVKYINVWVKQKDGNYQLDIDFWNNDHTDK